ncbi:uncharacterized protein M421DRAFT_173464 [Didymella exigua CBS 183.55]|uniref:Uncharacterized protein n=1 Tax=Didymella exigua CBS 183.55 TaxID=1150837 RepID=A0A6A5RHB0_9PLEO|nr:uncharacterized protein M421DRAFT_173464 [Didymella exigua CBS 183.55]KAF1927705.1 hypothetical protein M421DRAFT_173464 [Didymella exigua CBS 183.55]
MHIAHYHAAMQQKQSLACALLTYRATFLRHLAYTPSLTPVFLTGLTLQVHYTAVRWTAAGHFVPAALVTNQCMMRKSPPRYVHCSTRMQHLGLSRLSSPLNTSTASRLRCLSPQYRPRHPRYSYRCAVLIIAGIHVRQIWIPQVSMLLEILHPLLQERAAPEMCVSSVLWARRADVVIRRKRQRGVAGSVGLQVRDGPCLRHAPPSSSPQRFNSLSACHTNLSPSAM